MKLAGADGSPQVTAEVTADGSPQVTAALEPPDSDGSPQVTAALEPPEEPAENASPFPTRFRLEAPIVVPFRFMPPAVPAGDAGQSTEKVTESDRGLSEVGS